MKFPAARLVNRTRCRKNGALYENYFIERGPGFSSSYDSYYHEDGEYIHDKLFADYREMFDQGMVPLEKKLG